MHPYITQKGIDQLTTELSGHENIYLGIRPYGFHAGNETSFVIYPLMLCEALKKVGKEPKFNFFFFINDWEQDQLDGPQIKKYPYNVYPLKTTFQYMPDAFGCHNSIVDHWEPVIKENVLLIQKEYPRVKINLVRNSSLKKYDSLKNVLLKTIQEPKIVAGTLRLHSNKTILEQPLVYSMAVCPRCFLVKGETRIIDSAKSLVSHKCYMCGFEKQDYYDFFDYWLYHKVLALPRIEIFKIDLCITGLDHYNEGDFMIRKDLIDKFGISMPMPKMLYSPLILGADSRQMGKSRRNDIYVEVKKLLSLVQKSQYDEILIDESYYV